MEHRREQRHRSQAGFTLVEMMMGAIVFLIAAVVMGNHLTQNFRTTKNQRDRVFAYTKAQAILSEIHSLVDRGDVEAAIDLDRYDDGVQAQPTLSIEVDETTGTLIPADDPISGNTQRNGTWVWSRQISVRPFAGLNNRNMRYVTIRIFKSDNSGNREEMASLSSAVNSVASSFPSTQVFDVYLLAIDTIPGWWVYMEAIVPFVESAVTDLEARNPGLSVRTHWITKSGFGRNDVYKPIINDAVDSRDPIRQVYFYPGKMPEGSASTYYYVPDIIKGRINVDGVDVNTYDADTNPYPYSVADYFNHAMREPAARQLHELRKQAVETRAEEIRVAERNGLTPPAELADMSTEQPLQLLLNDMIAEPDLYRNAILVNLHGELLPTPPIRNYSDPAKSPEFMPYVRAVTHPEELRTQAPPGPPGSEEDVRFRVYAYLTDPTNARWIEKMPDLNPILLEVPGINLCEGQISGYLHPDVSLERLVGGTPVGPTRDEDYRPFEPAPMFYDVPLDPYFQEQMVYYAFYDTGGGVEEPKTVIYLFHTPVVCDQVNGKGLANSRRARLYGMEYVPSPTGTTNDFSHDLSSIGSEPKNTARWRLTIPKEAWANQWFVDMSDPYLGYDPRSRGESDVMVTARTRIYDSTTGDPWLNGQSPSGNQPYFIQPENLSETYTWWAQSRDAVPPVERYQIFGDPRHVPYKDCGHGDPDFPDAYNWFFDSLQNGNNARADFPGIARGWNRYNGGPHFDVPRVMQLFREALVSCNAIYTTLSGYSYYYVGVGNEIGYDSANGYPSSIPLSRFPYGDGETSTGFTNSITGARDWVRNRGGDHWWGMSWLGEMSPDWAYLSDWMLLDANLRPKGNLACGTTWNSFQREKHNNCYWGNGRWHAEGVSMQPADHRTATRGCVTFFNNGTSSRHFNHHPSGGSGSITGAGYDLRDNFGFPIPNSLSVNRPFRIDTGGNLPPEYNVPPYSTQRYRASILDTFYSFSSGRTSSGLVQIESPDRSSAAWIVVNGLAQTTTTGSAFLAKYCLLSMYQSFFELGDQSLTHRIQQPPRVEITDPTEISEILNPTAINIRVETDWVRWDRLPYTSSTPNTFAESEANLEYAVYYSTDNGYSWQHVSDNTPAVIGERPDPTYLIPDSGTGDQIISWPTPAGTFPEGSYVIRVEAYRNNVYLHYSVHQVKVYLQR